jgi:glycosyltransferase involved in cell wall biosynthesis
LKSVLIFYDHFYPAYKSGGPIQSLANMIRSLSGTYRFYIVCKSSEVGEKQSLPGIHVNAWNNWEDKAKVFYRSPGRKQIRTARLLDEVKPSIVYINGLYSLSYNIEPLKAALQFKRVHKELKIVVAPRGMLHAGALSQKSFKKKAFFQLFKGLKWHQKVHWHATDKEEQVFIEEKFGSQTAITIAGNFPKKLNPSNSPIKHKGELILGTIALISPMKNHLAVIQALMTCTSQVLWHVYGPVKDIDYWSKCEIEIGKLPNNVKVIYHGGLDPQHLQSAFDRFQVFIMPSKSENFGHALMEALSAGKPVITTDTTPLKSLEEHNAGFTLSEKKLSETLTLTIDQMADLDQESFQRTSQAAIQLYDELISVKELEDQYSRLFQ